MVASFRDIPRVELVGAGRIHRGFKDLIKVQAIGQRISAEERLHQILAHALGDPESKVPRRRSLQRTKAS